MKEVFRNEILEIGQIVLLYYTVNWVGENRGVGKLIRSLEYDAEVAEHWVIHIEDIGFRKWAMINPINLTKDIMSVIIHP